MRYQSNCQEALTHEAVSMQISGFIFKVGEIREDQGCTTLLEQNPYFQ